jgi:hypothetical protein
MCSGFVYSFVTFTSSSWLGNLVWFSSVLFVGGAELVEFFGKFWFVLDDGTPCNRVLTVQAWRPDIASVTGHLVKDFQGRPYGLLVST